MTLAIMVQDSANTMFDDQANAAITNYLAAVILDHQTEGKVTTPQRWQ